MATVVTLRIILPIDKKPEVKHHLSLMYQGWTSYTQWASLDSDTMALIVSLPPTVLWTQEDVEAFNAVFQGTSRGILFWDRLFGEPMPPPPESVISELLSALQGLVGSSDVLQVAYAFHMPGEHDKKVCPVCRANRLYEAYL